MPLTTQALDDLGDHMFLNAAAPNYGDAGGLQPSVAAGSTQLSLVTTAYTAASTLMTTNEAAYTGYGRPTQARSTGWTSVDGAIANAALEQFGSKTAGTDETEVGFGLSFIATGDFLQWFGTLTASRLVSNGTNPQFAIGALDLTIT